MNDTALTALVSIALPAACAVLLICAGAALSRWKERRKARRTAASTPPDAPEDTAPDGLDTAPDELETIPIGCLNCGNIFRADYHFHVTEEGIFAHLDESDIDLHMLTCSGANR